MIFSTFRYYIYQILTFFFIDPNHSYKNQNKKCLIELIVCLKINPLMLNDYFSRYESDHCQYYNCIFLFQAFFIVHLSYVH